LDLNKVTMARYADTFLSLADLYLAYRKAKVEAFSTA